MESVRHSGELPDDRYVPTALSNKLHEVTPIFPAFIINIALRSVTPHERFRHRWRQPWVHEEEHEG